MTDSLRPSDSPTPTVTLYEEHIAAGGEGSGFVRCLRAVGIDDVIIEGAEVRIEQTAYSYPQVIGYRVTVTFDAAAVETFQVTHNEPL